jgi:hypothetical protein
MNSKADDGSSDVDYLSREGWPGVRRSFGHAARPPGATANRWRGRPEFGRRRHGTGDAGGTGGGGGGQSGWRFCNQCLCLWFGDSNSARDNCPIGGALPHNTAGSGNYTLKQESDGGPGQKWWRYCPFCQALWFIGGGQTGSCSGGTVFGHYDAGFGIVSGFYVLETSTSFTNGTNGQTGWRHCANCQELVFAPNGGTVGACAAGGGHNTNGSTDYRIWLA